MTVIKLCFLLELFNDNISASRGRSVLRRPWQQMTCVSSRAWIRGAKYVDSRIRNSRRQSYRDRCSSPPFVARDLQSVSQYRLYYFTAFRLFGDEVSGTCLPVRPHVILNESNASIPTFRGRTDNICFRLPAPPTPRFCTTKKQNCGSRFYIVDTSQLIRNSHSCIFSFVCSS
jgi:hypothetical protein